MHLYCVDGSNLARLGSEGYREHEEADCAWLVEAFSELCRRLSARVEVELYFDGPYRPWAARAEAGLRVRFSHEVAADELILDRVRSLDWTKGGKATVVTADGDLGRAAEAEGGRWQAVRHGTRLESVLRAVEKRFAR